MKQQQQNLVANIQQARQHIRRLKKQAQVMDGVISGSNINNTNTNYNVTINNTNTITPHIPQQHPQFTINQYVNNALYSLVKNDQQLSTKLNQLKTNKLPSIYEKQLQEQQQLNNMYYINGYKKYRSNNNNNNNINNNTTNNRDTTSITKRSITIANKTNKVNSFSTRADQSFTIENRKMKIHSFQQKHKPIEISSETKLGSMLQYDQNNISSIVPEQVIVGMSKNRQQQRDALGSSHSSIRNRKYEQQKLKLINFNNQSTLNNNFQKQLNQRDISSKSFTKRQQQSLLLQNTTNNKYENAVDNFSNHYFMIIKGKTAIQTPQFSSYQRIYKSIFYKIEQQITLLQQLLTKYNISYGRFDGKKLAYLCLKQNIKRQSLIQCLVEGKQQLLAKFPQTKYKGKQGKIKAVNKLIAYWKMTVTRRKFLLLKQKTIQLQRYFRRQHLRLQLQHKIIARNNAISQRFEQRQLQFQQLYKQIMKNKRIQLHINSIQCDQQKRLTIQNFNQRQNIQLSRIFRLKDQNVIIVYVSSKEIPYQVVNYYYKILQLSDVKSFKDRLFFISPVRNKMLPEHLSTSKLLYYCSSTLKQLRNISEGTPTILYPGSPANQLIKIADVLGCYLYSGQPSKMRQFLSKSQTKRLLKNLCIQTLPGSMQMYDYGEFLNTFSVLIIKNPEISTWVLKIDDQFYGRGIAYIQLSKSKVISALLKKGTFFIQQFIVQLQQLQQHQQSQIFATDIISQPSNQQLTIKIRDYLKQKLPNKLTIVTQTLYRNYQQYMGRFIKKGGVIEAHPPCIRQLLSYPSVAFCLQPDGQMKIITTYQKILSQPYKSIACEFPQKSLQHQQLLSLCRQLTQSFKIRKLFGYFTVDLIFYRKNDQTKYWVLGIQPFVNNYGASFYLFDALMDGRYLVQEGRYLAEVYGEQVGERDNYTIRGSQSSSIASSNVSEKNKLVLKKSSSNTNSQPQHQILATRTYTFIPHFLNRNFCKINIKQFFKQARIQQFNFDIAQKHGICMMLFDELTSGELGLMAVGENGEGNVERLKRVLEFIAKVTNLKSGGVYGRSELQASTDAIYVSDVISRFLTMERKQKRKDAKKKAFEKHKNKQDLYSIS